MTRWDDVNFGAPPPWLGNAVGAVLSDLQRPRPIDMEWRYEPGDGMGTIWLRESGDEHGLAFWMPEETGEGSWFLLLLADRLQDQFFPETRSAWGEARPECPGHPHPADTVLVADEAWWACPLDGRRIARIGRLGRDSSPEPTGD